MKLRAEVVEILSGYSKAEIEAEIRNWQEALQAKEEWDQLSESEKDRLFEGGTV